jgi:hypothetical protein
MKPYSANRNPIDHLSQAAGLTAFVFSIACSPSSRVSLPDPPEALAANAERAGSLSEGYEHQVAVELAVTPHETKATNAGIVYTPKHAGSANPELLIRCRSQGKIIREYTIPDPLRAESGNRTIALVTAKVVLYLPISEKATVELQPLLDKSHVITQGVVIDISKLVKKACADHKSLPACETVLRGPSGD